MFNNNYNRMLSNTKYVFGGKSLIDNIAYVFHSIEYIFSMSASIDANQTITLNNSTIVGEELLPKKIKNSNSTKLVKPIFDDEDPVVPIDTTEEDDIRRGEEVRAWKQWYKCIQDGRDECKQEGNGCDTQCTDTRQPCPPTTPSEPPVFPDCCGGCGRERCEAIAGPALCGPDSTLLFLAMLMCFSDLQDDPQQCAECMRTVRSKCGPRPPYPPPTQAENETY